MHLFKISYQSYLEDILHVASNDLTSKPNTKNSLLFSNIPNKILPLLHLYTNTILTIRTTPRKPLFLMNSSNLFLVGSLSLRPLCHMKLQESTDADRSMLDITVTSKGIEKLLSNLNLDPTITNHKTSLPKVA